MTNCYDLAFSPSRTELYISQLGRILLQTVWFLTTKQEKNQAEQIGIWRHSSFPTIWWIQFEVRGAPASGGQGHDGSLRYVPECLFKQC